MTDWTETELSALRRAYASGTTRVSYDGKSVDYGSAEDRRVTKTGSAQSSDTANGDPAANEPDTDDPAADADNDPAQADQQD